MRSYNENSYHTIFLHINNVYVSLLKLFEHTHTHTHTEYIHIHSSYTHTYRIHTHTQSHMQKLKQLVYNFSCTLELTRAGF